MFCEYESDSIYAYDSRMSHLSKNKIKNAALREAARVIDKGKYERSWKN